jgi:hypothetical protein
MKIEDITKSMTEKLGKDEASKIADDFASLLTLEASRLKEMKEKDATIDKLQKDKETLITANGNLLQQISSETEDILKPEIKEEVKHEPFDMRNCFDEKGRFKTKL